MGELTSERCRRKIKVGRWRNSVRCGDGKIMHSCDGCQTLKSALCTHYTHTNLCSTI